MTPVDPSNFENSKKILKFSGIGSLVLNKNKLKNCYLLHKFENPKFYRLTSAYPLNFENSKESSKLQALRYPRLTFTKLTFMQPFDLIASVWYA